MYKTHTHKPDGTVGLIMHEGEPLSAIKELAQRHVDSGAAVKVEVFDETDQLVYHYPRIMDRA